MDNFFFTLSKATVIFKVLLRAFHIWKLAKISRGAIQNIGFNFFSLDNRGNKSVKSQLMPKTLLGLYVLWFRELSVGRQFIYLQNQQ